MKNPAVKRHYEFNDFTQYIYNYPGTSVLLRNDRVVQPIVFLGEDEWERDFSLPRGFTTKTWSMCWNLDGTSVTRSDYDMMEIFEKIS